MAITKNKIATRRACNNISTVVNAGFSGELDQCPTKSEINATKKIIVLESGVRSNDRNLTANYSDNQCIKEEDIGHYVKLDYEYDLPGSAKVNFHKDRVNTSNFDASVTEYFTAFTNSMSTGNGTNEVALTPSFFEQGWGSDLEITVSYGSSTSDVQQMFINSYPGTKSSDGTYFKWNNGNSSLIMSGLASRTMKLVVTETAADVITYGIVMSPTTISNMTQGSTKQLTVKYYKYVNGLADQTSVVDVTSQCSYEVSNTAVTVSSSGLVTAGNKGGSATITATYNGYTDTTSVSVQSVTTYEFIVEPTTLNILCGETGTIAAKFNTKTDGVDSWQTVTDKCNWKTSNSNIAISMGNGEVLGGNTTGTTTITATYPKTNPSYTATTEVTNSYAEKELTGITTSPSSVSQPAGMTSNIKVYAQYSDGSQADVTSMATVTPPSGSFIGSYSNGVITHGNSVTSTTWTVSYSEPNSSVFEIPLVVTNQEPIPIAITVNPSAITMNVNSVASFEAAAMLSDGLSIPPSGLTYTTDATQGNLTVAVDGNEVKVTSGGKIATHNIKVSCNYGGLEIYTTVSVTIQPEVVTLTSIEFDSLVYTMGVGGYSYPKVNATYSDGTTKNVTSSCTFTITDSSTIGVCSWNSIVNTLLHGVIGTAKLNASYTEGRVTQTATVPVETVKRIPTEVYLTPSPVSVAVGETVTVDVTMDLNNGYTGAVPTEEQISISYINAGENYIEASLSGNTISVKGKAETVSGSYLSVYVTYNEVTIITQLVVEVTEAGENNDTNIIMTISNLNQIITSKHAYGLDERLTFVNGNGNTVDVGLTYDLYYFDDSYDNTVSGPASAWQTLYDLYFNDIYLYDYEEIISGTLEGGHWNTILEAINKAKNTGEEQTIQIEWPMKAITGTTYELEVTPNSSTIEIGESTQFTATYWTLEKGERTTSIDVTSDATWTSSNSTLATVDKGYVTGINQGVDIEITATYNTVSDTSWVEVAEPETVSIPVTFSAENWGNSGQECDIMISARLYNYKTQQSQPICSNKHIVVGDAGNGRPAYYETLATVQINPDEKSDWNMQLWGYPYSCTSGVFSVNLMSPLSDRYYQIIQDIDTDTDWQTADSYPYEGSLSNYYEGDSIDIYFRGDY